MEGEVGADRFVDFDENSLVDELSEASLFDGNRVHAFTNETNGVGALFVGCASIGVIHRDIYGGNLCAGNGSALGISNGSN